MRASSPVSHCEVPSAAAMRPSRLAAAFHTTNGRAWRRPWRNTSFWRRARLTVRVELDRDAVAAELLGAARRERVGVGERGDDARHACGDERIGAGAGAAGVGAGLERDVGGGAGGAVARLLERGDLGVGAPGALVPALAHDLPVAHEHAADQRVGRDRATPTLRQRERAVEPPLVLLADRRGLLDCLRRLRGRANASGDGSRTREPHQAGASFHPDCHRRLWRRTRSTVRLPLAGSAAGSRAPPGSPRELPPVGDFTLPRRRMFDCGVPL